MDIIQGAIEYQFLWSVRVWALVCIFFIDDTSSFHIALMFQLVVYVSSESDGLVRYIKRKEDNVLIWTQYMCTTCTS